MAGGKTEIIKLELRAKTAHFRIYSNQNFCDSYPLPPPSTILGILQEVLGIRPPEPLILAIKGSFESIFFDYRTFLEKPLELDLPKRREQNKEHRFWIEKLVHRSVTTKPLFIKVLYNPSYSIYLYSPSHHLSYLNKLKEPERFISLGRSEDLAMMKVSAVEVEKKRADKLDKIKIENSYLPVKVYGAVSIFLPICHLNQDRNLRMEMCYYVKEAISYYEGEYWQVKGDKDNFVWLVNYEDTEKGNLPKLYHLNGR
ncbi:MAG: CRISPR-associated protein Cas5 [Candidatus Omnitrophica bacterium]|nr:CRISPR-associated protein Cas5 [Candidatus Omnitrophota bacterium]